MTDEQPQIIETLPEFSVSELSQSIKMTVEGAFSHVRVRGELSKVTLARSGHLYTDLKDDNAVLNAVCWRGAVSNLSIKPEEGLEVICTGKVTTYPGRSNYQLVISTMELAGQGALLKMLEERKKKLTAEGLFDASRKKALPKIPRHIGIVTSPTGAVIRDILHRLTDRFPRPVTVWPANMQGTKTVADVVAGIQGFNSLSGEHRPDLIIVARGGGSLEDLMPFNEEAIVRAVAASDIPVMSAIGHETDTTLIDYVADLRAPTPTAAAELAVPVRSELLQHIGMLNQRMTQTVFNRINQDKANLRALSASMGDPQRILDPIQQRFDYLVQNLDQSIALQLREKTQAFNSLGPRLSKDLMTRIIEGRTKDLGSLASLLQSLSYKGVLARGFTMVTGADGHPIQSKSATKAGQSINLTFHDGQVSAVIEEGGKSKSKQGDLF